MKKRDRNNCLFYYVIMKILTTIGLIISILNPINNHKYINPSNNTGNSAFNYSVQISYSYSAEEVYSINMALGYNEPMVYVVNYVINFDNPVDSATLHIFFNTPDVITYQLNYICEFCEIQYSTYNELEIQAHNTNVCYIKVIFTYKMINEMYDYNWVGDNVQNPYDIDWVSHGDNYFYIVSSRLDACTLETSNNYNSSLNSLIANTDGIEGLLQSIITNTSTIATNTSYLSTISTNINTLKTTLNNIYTLVNSMSSSVTNQSYLFKNTNGIMCSIDNTVKNIGYMFSGNYQEYISNDFISHGSGPSAQIYAVVYDPDNDINSNYEKNKIKIVIKCNTNTDNTYYYFNVPLNDSDSIIQSTETLMTYNVNSQLFNRITITFYVSNNFIGFNIAAWQTSPSGSFSPGTATWTVVNNCYSTDADISTEEILYSIEELLSNINVNVDVDMTNKNTVDSFFEQLKQSLTLPSIPQSFNDTIFEKMNILLRPYVRMVINFSRYRNVLMIASLFTIIGVILL